MAKRYRPAISYRLREIPLKSVKVWKDAQARKLDRKGVTELARSIKTEGLQNPPMVQKEGKEYLLMSGQRRLAALKRLKAKKIPALVLTKNAKYELDDAKAASVVENLHRKDMETREMALACAFLADKKGKSKAAQSLGISKIMFKKYHGFAGVPEAPSIFETLSATWMAFLRFGTYWYIFVASSRVIIFGTILLSASGTPANP